MAATRRRVRAKQNGDTQNALAGTPLISGNTFNNDQKAFITGVYKGTHISPAVIGAWVLAEGGPPDNPLNIGPGNHYSTVNGGIRATVDLLHGSLYKGILASTSKSDNDQIAAIVASPWCPGCAGYSELLHGTYDRAKNDFKLGHDEGIVSAATGGVSDAVSGVTGGVGDVVGFIGKLFEPSLWLRIGKAVLGLILLIMGFITLMKVLVGVDVPLSPKAALT